MTTRDTRSPRTHALLPESSPRVPSNGLCTPWLSRRHEVYFAESPPCKPQPGKAHNALIYDVPKPPWPHACMRLGPPSLKDLFAEATPRGGGRARGAESSAQQVLAALLLARVVDAEPAGDRQLVTKRVLDELSRHGPGLRPGSEWAEGWVRALRLQLHFSTCVAPT